MPVRITVVMPVLNEERFLPETLAWLRRQTFTDFELVVVDNGSTDQSPEIARRFADRLIVEPQRGAVFAMHRGFTEAAGELVACADADTLYPSGWLAKMVKALDAAGVVAAYGPMGFRESGPVRRRLEVLGYSMLAGLSRAFGVPLAGAANLGMWKDAYFAVGGYPPLAHLASPDFRLVQKLARVGRVRFVPTMACYTSNRRFVRANLVSGFYQGFRYWLDVALGRGRLTDDQYWGREHARRKTNGR
ncbi:MAG: glycosyltransferase [Candidatus Acetothermia bacterium]|jgi:glycosyltransferase involved in cell wall biosynthesis|nr:glycosyltransferase [Candidatus Acetothermia bacterium]